MNSERTFQEELTNVGQVPGVLYTEEQLSDERPPDWRVAQGELGETAEDELTVAPTVDILSDDALGPGGLVLGSLDSELLDDRRPPDELIADLLGIDVEVMVASHDGDGRVVRSKIADATAQFGTDAFATYLPWHKYSLSRRYRWGMWFFLEPLSMWAYHLWQDAVALGLSLTPDESFRLAFYIAYRHEQFHFHVERFSLRQEVLLRRPIYLPYDTAVYSHPSIVNSKDWLEEALAQATVLESVLLYRRMNRKKAELSPFIARQFRTFGPGYRDFKCASYGGPERAHRHLGAQIMTADRIPGFETTSSFSPKREYGTSSLAVPGYLAYQPDFVERFQLAMPKVRDWERWARRNGFELVGHMGDHRIWERAGHRVQVNPKNKECDLASMKAVATHTGMKLRQLLEAIRAA